MEKTCPLRFDVECINVIECQVPRKVSQCEHLVVDLDSGKVFMSNPVHNCTAICTRTGKAFSGDDLALVIKCTQEHFNSGTCPRADEPDSEQ